MIRLSRGDKLSRETRRKPGGSCPFSAGIQPGGHLGCGCGCGCGLGADDAPHRCGSGMAGSCFQLLTGSTMTLIIKSTFNFLYLNTLILEYFIQYTIS